MYENRSLFVDCISNITYTKFHIIYTFMHPRILRYVGSLCLGAVLSAPAIYGALMIFRNPDDAGPIKVLRISEKQQQFVRLASCAKRDTNGQQHIVQ